MGRVRPARRARGKGVTTGRRGRGRRKGLNSFPPSSSSSSPFYLSISLWKQEAEAGRRREEEKEKRSYGRGKREWGRGLFPFFSLFFLWWGLSVGLGALVPRRARPRVTGGVENDEGRRDGLGPTFWGGRRQTFIFCFPGKKWEGGGRRQVAKINKSICRRERTVLLPLRSRPVRNPAAKK